MDAADGKTVQEISSIRDMVESVWVAIVLAFVLRAFMIEAFVIPTGSMAPRLMGRHWELRCPACGYRYALGFSSASAEDSDWRANSAGPRTPTRTSCPNCGYDGPPPQTYVDSGDRVLVLKYLYHFTEPQPWDVVVFRNPQDNRQNYIKRLIGLPGEIIEIVHGDIFFRRGLDRDGDGRVDADGFDFNGDGKFDEKDLDDSKGLAEHPWQIRRKPARAQEAMWQIVFDNDYRPDADLLASAEVRPPRWEPAAKDAKDEKWDLTGVGGREFAFAGGAQSDLVLAEAPAERFLPRYAYNFSPEENRNIDRKIDICSDLRLSAVFQPQDASATVGLTLTSLEDRFRAEVGADGTVTLFHHAPARGAGEWKKWQRKLPALPLDRGTDIALAHADFRLTVQVNGEAVLAVDDEIYGDPALNGGGSLRDRLLKRLREVPGKPIPTPQVGLSARGGPCRLRHVKLMRDVYYTSSMLDTPGYGPESKYAEDAQKAAAKDPSKARNNWNKGLAWGVTGNPIALASRPDRTDFDEFFVLGDNSPQSLDGRAWTKAAPTLMLYDDQKRPIYQLGTVPRYAMIGKAMFVYWPAGFRLPGLPGLPIVPNVGRMRLIR